jgi:S1-C subfamily serine protease
MTTLRAGLFVMLLSLAIGRCAFGQSDSSSVSDQLIRQAQSAHLALAAAKSSVEKRLKSDAGYQALAAKLQDATEKVNQARASNSARELQQAAVDKMSVGTDLSNYVKHFAVVDPVVIQAQKDADAADAAIAAVQNQIGRSQSTIQKTVETEYDKFNDETTVHTAGIQSFQNVAPVGEMSFHAIYSFKGQVQSEAPTRISLLIFCLSRDWVFLGANRESLRLMVIVDGSRRISFPLNDFDDKVVPELDPLACQEALEYNATYEQLKAMANAKTIEAKISTCQFNFTSEQLSATKDLFATITPPKQTNTPSPDLAAAPDAVDGWSGTGFMVSAEGLILTNRHVAVDEENPQSDAKLDVFVSGIDKPFRAKLIGVDKEQDLALIKIESSTPLAFVHFSAEDFPSPGSDCNILGFPLTQDLGVSLKITHGNVTTVHQSGANDPWATDGRDVMMDAKSNAGNSGGPLLNQHGEVVGILAAKTAAERFKESYTIGISTGHIRDFMRRCNVAIPPASTDEKELHTEDIFKLASPCVVRIRGIVGE